MIRLSRSIFSVFCWLVMMLCASDNKAQIAVSLSATLKTGSVAKLNDYIIHNEEIYTNDFKENSIYWRLYREVLPGYYEGTMQLIFTEAYSDWRHKQFRQQVKVLVKDSTIFYYQIASLDSFNRYNNSLDSNTNAELLQEFQNDFFKTYNTKLNRKFLFIDSINYGEHCNEKENSNPEFDKMLQFVATKNFKTLNEWLRCGNSELQLFAVKGFLLLKAQQQKINPETLQLIHLVLQKKGNINFCIYQHERRIQMDKLRRDYLNDE